MSAAPSIFSTGNLLKNFVFTYFPMTDWRRFISPTIVFGDANIADSDIEQKVVDSVGSYGYQLNRILDALAVLIRENEDQKTLHPEKAHPENAHTENAHTENTQAEKARAEMDRRVLDRLLDLADAADKAARQAKKR